MATHLVGRHNLRGLRAVCLTSFVVLAAALSIPSAASAQLLGPTFSINDVTVLEGNAGTVNAVFTVTISAAPPAGAPANVNFATQNGTATAPGDYTANSGTLTFRNGEPTTQTVTVVVNGDNIDESNETFNVKLSNAAGATIADDTGVGTITDDDIGPDPTASINDVTVTEGNTGTTNAVFTVTLSRAPHPGEPAEITYTTQNGTATHPEDYTETSGTLVFLPGQASKQVTVAVKGELLAEPNETFSVVLVNPVRATITDNTGIGTISDDDAPDPVITIADTAIAEGNAGTTNAAFTVSLDRAVAAGETVTVNYATQNGTAVQPGDYLQTSGVLSFDPGETSKQILVAVNGDTLDEADETFIVFLSGPSGATIDENDGIGTITNDDGGPSGPGESAFPVIKTAGADRPVVGPRAKSLLITAICRRGADATCVGTFEAAADLPGRRGKLKTFRLGEVAFSIERGDRATLKLPISSRVSKRLKTLDEKFSVTILTSIVDDGVAKTETITVRVRPPAG